MISRRELLRVASAATVLGPASTIAIEARVPDEMRIVIPYSPGGATGTLARILAEQMSKRLDNVITLDYRPGAGSMVGIAHVARAPADGSALVIISSSFIINPLLRASAPYRVEDLRPVTQLADLPLVLAANPDTPYDTISELVEHFQRTGRDVEFAVLGLGGPSHLGGELLGRIAGLRTLPIAYKGSPSAHADVIAGRVPLLIEPLGPAIPQAQAGRLKIIGVFSPERIRGFEQYPALSETFPGLEASTFLGFVAPAGTPDETIDKVSAAAIEALGLEENRDRLKDLGLFAQALGPRAFARLLENDQAKWAAVIREQKITVE